MDSRFRVAWPSGNFAANPLEDGEGVANVLRASTLLEFQITRPRRRSSLLLLLERKLLVPLAKRLSLSCPSDGNSRRQKHAKRAGVGGVVRSSDRAFVVRSRFFLV